MSELKEGMDALTEDRHMTRDQLLKDYAAIIDEQQELINRAFWNLNNINLD
jgi:hypothetical protein